MSLRTAAMLGFCIAVGTTSLQAQLLVPLDDVVIGSLSHSGTAEASFFLPNAAELRAATLALGFVYEYIPGSAGNTGIAVGAFVPGEDGWELAGLVQGVFGQSPRDAAYGTGFVDVTTTVLGPNEPRCCPTQAARWRIDFSTLLAQRLY